VGKHHFIPKCLTKPWRHRRRGGDLRVFDIETKRIVPGDNETLFTREDLNADETERFFNRLIETPFATFQARLRAARGDRAAVQRAANDLPRVALYGIYFLQAQRIDDAMHLGKNTRRLHADDIARRGAAFLESEAERALADHEAILYGLGDNQLFFPSTAMFPIPIRRAAVLALPVHTSWALALVPRDGSRAEVDERMADPMFVTSLSVAAPRARQFLVPPVLTYGDDKKPLDLGDDGSLPHSIRTWARMFLNVMVLARHAARSVPADPWGVLENANWR
jgi:hypothetical protein